MNPPAPYSLFHIIFIAIGLAAVVFLAYYTTRKINSSRLPRLLFFCGLLLAATECWKQLFLYYVVNEQTYNWWYFPFQLCSLPMYFCLILPLVPSRDGQRVLCTFMQDFNLLGGVMALAEPSGLMHPFLVLTLHGFIWHFILIFIGLYCAFAGLGGQSLSEFADTLPFFCGCAAAATFINVASHPYGNADMFYISPYYPNGQVVFHQIALTIGTVPGNILYLLSVVLGGFLFHVMLRHIPRQC